MNRSRLFVAAGVAAAALFALPTLLLAQDDREPGLYDQAEVSIVLTTGNSESSAFGLKNRLSRVWESSRLTFDVGALRIETGEVNRVAIGTGPADFTVEDEVDRETTAETYRAALRFDRELSERTYAYASGDWLRDRPAGIDNRTAGAAGIGRKLIASERTQFQVDIGATLTNDDPLIGDSESFAGLRFTWDFAHELTETTRLTSVLAADENLSDTDDLRIEVDNGLGVSISESLALKTGLKFRYDNQPALVEVELLDAPGGTSLGQVAVELDKLDSQFTVALVVTL